MINRALFNYHFFCIENSQTCTIIINQIIGCSLTTAHGAHLETLTEIAREKKKRKGKKNSDRPIINTNIKCYSDIKW